MPSERGRGSRSARGGLIERGSPPPCDPPPGPDRRNISCAATPRRADSENLSRPMLSSILRRAAAPSLAAPAMRQSLPSLAVRALRTSAPAQSTAPTVTTSSGNVVPVDKCVRCTFTFSLAQDGHSTRATAWSLPPDAPWTRAGCGPTFLASPAGRTVTRPPNFVVTHTVNIVLILCLCCPLQRLLLLFLAPPAGTLTTRAWWRTRRACGTRTRTTGRSTTPWSAARASLAPPLLACWSSSFWRRSTPLPT